MSGQSVRGIQESVAVGMIQVLFVILYTVTFTKEKKKVCISGERIWGCGFSNGDGVIPAHVQEEEETSLSHYPQLSFFNY